MLTRKVFHNGVQRFKQAGIPDCELEVSLLLSHVLEMERTAVLLAGEKDLNSNQIEIFEKYMARRLAREPLAYIIGEKEFWSLPFKVSRDVLIPRPETEFLVESSLTAIKKIHNKPGSVIRILDLGTGSGVIAVIMALELVRARITAIDRSFKALKIAYNNAQKHQVARRINFVNCDWFGGLRAETGFDAVITNPPYIAREVLTGPFGREAGSLQPEVGNHEPNLALDGGKHGVQAIGNIAAGLGKVLKPGGWLFMEIGADQEKEVMSIFSRTAAFDNIAVNKDYAGRPRVFQARRLEKRWNNNGAKLAVQRVKNLSI